MGTGELSRGADTGVVLIFLRTSWLMKVGDLYFALPPHPPTDGMWSLCSFLVISTKDAEGENSIKIL